jgi:hypothetical protein
VARFCEDCDETFDSSETEKFCIRLLNVELKSFWCSSMVSVNVWFTGRRYRGRASGLGAEGREASIY